MNLKKIWVSVNSLLYLLMAYYGVILKVEWVSNVLIFFSWLTFFAMLSVLSPAIMAERIKNYEEKNLHRIIDIVFYLSMMAILASQKWWLTAICWALVAGLDFSVRAEYNKNKREFKNE